MEKDVSKPFITLEDVTLRLHDRLIFKNSFWQINSDEHWAILGPNGSGKSTLVRSLWGGVPTRSGRIIYQFYDKEELNHIIPPRELIGYVSSETHQNLMNYEAEKEEMREFGGVSDESTNSREVIFSGIMSNRSITPLDEERLIEIVDLLDINDLLDRSIISLSTGEIRKVLIARALIKSPRLLVLDEPFDGLDEKSRISLSESINHIMLGPLRVILVVHRLEEIVPNITHVLMIKDGKIFLKGEKEDILTSENINNLYGCDLILKKTDQRYIVSYSKENIDERGSFPFSGNGLKNIPEILIEMKDMTVKYGDNVVLDRLSWVMKRGENWAILGPNGSGKSTIIRLILGDNLQGYANQMSIFGKRKGTGETLWEIKKHIGVVSSEFQIQYRKRMSAYDVIASGFYDSIGLYQFPTEEQKLAVNRWIEVLDIHDIAKEPYHHLSYGQKRMILLARAIVKSPILLILDEPCHGLDISNRRRILEIMEKIGKTDTNLLYVTNHKEEILDCITHIMRIQKGKILIQGEKEKVLRSKEDSKI